MRLVGAMGFGVGTELMVREVIDKNGNIIEEVQVVADKIDDSDAPPANILFALSSNSLVSTNVRQLGETRFKISLRRSFDCLQKTWNPLRWTTMLLPS